MASVRQQRCHAVSSKRVNGDLVKLLASTEIRQKLESIGVDAKSMTPEEFAGFIDAEMKRWAGVVRDAGIQAQ